MWPKTALSLDSDPDRRLAFTRNILVFYTLIFRFLLLPLLYTNIYLYKINDMTKKVLAVTLVAAVASVAVYAYVQNNKKKKRRNLPLNFI
ncbi:hypothetical protein JCM30204_41820 [Dysgonomonas termitidis]|jgi:uncharacterized membrane protein